MSSEQPPKPIVSIFNPAYWDTTKECDNHNHPYLPDDAPYPHIQSQTTQDPAPYTAQVIGTGGVQNSSQVGNSIVQELGVLEWVLPQENPSGSIQLRYNFSLQIADCPNPTVASGGANVGTTQNNIYTDSGTLLINPYYLTESFSNYTGFPALGVVFEGREQSTIVPTGAPTWTNLITQLYIKYDAINKPNQINFFYVNRNDLCYNATGLSGLQPKTTITFSMVQLTQEGFAGSSLTNTSTTQTEVIPTIVNLSATGGDGTYNVPVGYNRISIFAVGKGGLAGGGSYPDSGEWATGGAGGGGGIGLLNFTWIDPYSGNTSFNYLFNNTYAGEARVADLVRDGVAQSLQLEGYAGGNGATGTYTPPGAAGGTMGTFWTNGNAGATQPDFSSGYVFNGTGSVGGQGDSGFDYASPVPPAGIPDGGVPALTTYPVWLGEAFLTGYTYNANYAIGQNHQEWLGYTSGGYVNEPAGQITNAVVSVLLYPNW